MSMAIAYAMKKQGKKMAQGGSMPCAAHGMDACKMCHGGKMAEGGEVEDEASGYHDMPIESPEVTEDYEYPEDIVGRIMMSRDQGYSEGGRVANDTPPVADFEDNQFDDLVKRDDLEQHYTGANSGDEIGNDSLEEQVRDIVSRIMRSRGKKDRMPVPA